MSNFKEILAQLKSAQGIVQIIENEDMPQALAQEVMRLLADKSNAQTLGSNSYKVVQANQGATAQSLTALTTLLKS